MEERYTAEEFERFSSKVTYEGDCHLWNGPLDKDGYGTFYFRRRSRRAHRVAYYFGRGDIPTGLVVDHICKARACVKLSHLRTLTARENTMGGVGVGAQNAKRTHCLQGHIFDRFYGKQRYCSVCQAEKTKRLRAKWKFEDSVMC